MANHFSAIGLVVRTPDEYIQSMLRAAETGELIETAEGQYILWQAGNGAELWVQVDSDGEIVGANPHFAGNSVMQVRLTERLKRFYDSSLDGAFRGWANPDAASGTIEEGDYPFVFDAPDYRLHDEVTLPAIRDVQLAAFAHELLAFESEKSYYRSQEGKEVKFAAESFIPTGLFVPSGEDEQSTQVPLARALLTGRVIQLARLAGDEGASFYWAKVRTLGGEVDMVADTEIVEGEIREGGIVQGTFWLSGRLAPPPD